MFVAPSSLVKSLIGAGLPRRRGPSIGGDVEIHYLDLTPLKIRSSLFTPFLIAQALAGSTVPTSQKIAAAVESIRRAEASLESGEFSDYSFAPIGPSLSEEAAHKISEALPSTVVPLFQDQIAALNDAEGQGVHAAIGGFLAAHLGPSVLTPYVIQKPAVSYRFFGRQRLLRTVAGRSGESVTIVGNRRVGKTSLLKEIRFRLFLQFPETAFVEIYGANTDETEDFAHKIVSEGIHSFSPAQIRTDDHQYKRWITQARSLIEREKRPLAIFIDELDHVLERDRLKGFELLNLLRELAESEYCRIFFAGFRETMRASQDVDHPLFNFTRVLTLGPLTRAESAEMISVPLRNLGLEASSDLVGHIYQESGGQPELIQHMCSEAIHFFVENDRMPLEPELSELMMNSKAFEISVQGAFKQNCNALERLACYLVLRSARGEAGGVASVEFTERDLMGMLRAEMDGSPARALDAQLRAVADHLEMSGTIGRVPGKGFPPSYRFLVPSFGRYCMAKDLDYLIEETKTSLRAELA